MKKIDKFVVIFDFVMKIYFRKNYKERDAFGIWLILICVYESK